MTLTDSRKRLRRVVGTDDLTQRQAEVLTYMLRKWVRGYVPTIHDMMAQFGWTPNGVMCHVRALKRKGYLQNEHRRGYQLTDKALDLAL